MARENCTWVNGKRTVTGTWSYNWSSDTFTIWLDQRDRTTGQRKVVRTTNDTPEWGNWKLVRDKEVPNNNVSGAL